MRAIDVHWHTATKERWEATGDFIAGMEAALGKKFRPKTEEEMADDLRRDDVLGMMIAWDAQTMTGSPNIIPNDWVAGLTRKFPDVFLPGWAMVDPWKGKLALQEMERAIKELGLTGVKWMPALQGFFPDDRHMYPFWDLCQSLGVPVLIHTGTTLIGGGMPGGGGIRLKYVRPIPHIDDMAVDFPRLTIVMAHPAWPWTEEAIAVLLHKPNVYQEISGWRPKYIPEALKREIGRRLQDKILFGSDYPGWSPAQCLDELEMEKYKPEVMDKLLFKNAIRVLGLEDKVRVALAAGKSAAEV